MKILAYSLIFCCYVASSATGGDSREMHRERVIVCSQFVIEEPDPTLARDATQYCCRVANWIRDCHVDDWNEQYR
jgi:hypothetical protein